MKATGAAGGLSQCVLRPPAKPVALIQKAVVSAVRCPICEREFDPAAPDAVKPFCSARCRTIDLGRWLGEGYAFPAARPRGSSAENAGEDDAAEGADF